LTGRLFAQEFVLVMVFPNIEKIKQEYTDKYVVVDPQRPELARFADVVGQVKTVNMSGRALVEFLDYHLNIGWYDIELEFLKVVDKPEPKAKEEKKPAPKAEAKPAEAKAAPAAKPAAGGKASTSDILAKLRGGGGGAAPAAPAKKEEAPKAEAKPAAAPGKVDRGKMSVAEMLAAARGGAAAAPAAKSEPPAPKVEAPAPAKVEAPAAAATPPAVKASSPGGVVKVDRSKMSVAQMVAYCREKDAE
jgi:pyruvate/2-oxoglutarate dehydrogenase complex dihydrolipoamide acyltransferase (E2) component